MKHENANSFPYSSNHEGQNYIVTGGASGIGRRTAELLVAEGASVVLADISAKVVEVAEQLNTAFTVGDLTEPVNCKATVDKAIAEFGNIDGVVVAAGVVDSKHLIDTAEEEFSRVININVMAPFQIAKAALPHMRDSGRNPSFVFVGSKDAFDVVPGLLAYSVSKAALLQLSKTIAIEEGRYGVRSNVLHPDVVIEGSGLWDEELQQNRASKHGVDVSDLAEHYKSRNALGIALSTDDMAYAISYLLSQRARAVSGTVITVDGGYGPAFPR